MRVLFIGAHTDDIEINCGGTVVKHIEEGHDVCCASLSDINSSQLRHEFTLSMGELGVSNFVVESFERRVFSQNRQLILDYLIQLGKFDRVFTHDQSDIHQDHLVVGHESIRAFPTAEIFTYVNTFNDWGFADNVFVRLTEDHLLKKMDSIARYESQKHRIYCNPEIIRSTALINGIQARSEYAESFKALRFYL